MTLAVRIRLSRVGATKRPSYRVVAIDSRRPRDGRALEILGFYDPRTEPATVKLDAERIQAWIGKGAQPSEMVARLIRQAGSAAAPLAPEAKPARRAPARKKAVS
jgi:small subunit ribosomal protein S16